MVDGLKEGVGIHYFKSRMVYKGVFAKDKWDGSGMLAVSLLCAALCVFVSVQEFFLHIEESVQDLREQFSA